MNFIRLTFVFFACLFICSSIAFAQSDISLAKQLVKLAEDDQEALLKPPKGNEFGTPAYEGFIDSVFESHYLIVKNIFEKHGFPGYDLVGEEGSKSFWLIVQHSDKWQEFQAEVLDSMKNEVDANNASRKNYAYLVDRVRNNSDKQQVYGTQVSYYKDKCQAYISNLEDPKHVNDRRKKAGLENLEVYLNRMSRNHFWMNEKMFRKRGITSPTLYPTK